MTEPLDQRLRELNRIRSVVSAGTPFSLPDTQPYARKSRLEAFEWITSNRPNSCPTTDATLPIEGQSVMLSAEANCSGVGRVAKGFLLRVSERRSTN